jgi:hypothetical protein
MDPKIGKTTIGKERTILLNLLRVKTHVYYNLYVTPFWSYPSQYILVKLIKLRRTQTVCTEKERKREREKKQRESKVFLFFSQKKNNSHPKKYKNI